VKILISVLIVIHGLIVAAQSAGSFGTGKPIANPAWLAWWPTGLGQSWLLAWLGLEASPMRPLGGIVWLAGGVALVAAGLALMGVGAIPDDWRILALVGAVLSLIMFFIYFHPFLIVGITASLLILFAIWWQDGALLAQWAQ
jgi:hypothetical protein